MDEVLDLFRLAATNCVTNNGLLPNLYDGIKCVDDVPTIENLGEAIVLVGNIMRILIALSGGAAVIVIVVAAIYYIISAGDPGRVKKAKDILINTGLGLLLIIGAYALVTFIAKGF